MHLLTEGKVIFTFLELYREREMQCRKGCNQNPCLFHLRICSWQSYFVEAKGLNKAISTLNHTLDTKGAFPD